MRAGDISALARTLTWAQALCESAATRRDKQWDVHTIYSFSQEITL